MANPINPRPDRRLQDAAASEAAANRETKRPSDSVPVITGTFANLPAKFGRYQVERLLGKGAMGAVYLARDTQLGRLVALKIPKVAASGSKRMLLRLETEAKAAAQLDHPSLCKVFDAGQVDGQCFIAMQYIEGETLKSQLEAKGKSVQEAINLILQLAEGLAEAHAMGIIHRDLKPENIMINRRGTAVIMDFGLAKFSTMTGNAEATQAGTILGTPIYMSPEQASGNVTEIDQRSDIYALGIILFELLTGAFPFSGSAMQILGQKSVLDPASPLSLKPELPPGLAAICHRMIARSNGDRYQRLPEVISDLKDLNLAETLQVAPPSVESAAPAAFADFEAAYQAERSLPATDKAKKNTTTAGKTSQGGCDSSAASTTSLQKLSDWWNGRPTKVKWTALGGAAFAILCGVIIITITNKDGTQTKIEAPETSKVEIERKPGNHVPHATPNDKTDRIVRPTMTGWHGWPVDAPVPAIAPFDAKQAKAHQEAWAKYLNVDAEYTNSIGMKFCLIPPGEFLMGSTPKEIEAGVKAAANNQRWQDCIKSEAPRHKVILTQPIYLGVNEVTQSEYQKVMGVDPSAFSPTGQLKEGVTGIETTEHPVEQLSWNDAAEFCIKLSTQEKLKPFYFRTGETITPLNGTGYRLPSEAEWEFACRAGTITTYWIGDQNQDLKLAAWYEENAGGRTHAVGELKANPFGLFDMHGNVWEYVQDGWDANYYRQFQEIPAVNPISPFSTRSQRMVRGGHALDPAFYGRSASRYDCEAPNFSSAIGFRVSLMVDAVKAATAERKTQPVAATTNWQGWPIDAPSPAIAPFDAKQAEVHQKAWAKYLNVDVEYTNSIGMKFRLVPPGEFMMGSSVEQVEEALKLVGTDRRWQDRIKSEAPRHKVILTQPIYLGVNEVTQAEYEEMMGNNPSHFATTGKGKDAVSGLATAKHPVEMVSWNDAAEFCAKLSQQEKLKPFYSRVDETITSLKGTGYRIPSEAEWEFACRAGTETKYWIGDKDQDLSSASWYGGNSGGRTHAASDLQANPFGFHDMQGNVWEWVEDWWNPTYYGEIQAEPAIDPKGSAAGLGRVYRGGDWIVPAVNCRAANRIFGAPNARGMSLGFRVALVINVTKAGAARISQPVNVPSDVPPGTSTLPPKAEAAPKIDQMSSGKKAGQEWSENGLGMKFCWCPPGKFTMGSPRNEPGRLPNEDPVKVTLTRGFWLGKTEVTQRQWRTVLGKGTWSNQSLVTEGDDYPAVNIKHGGVPGGASEPDSASEFCEKFTAQERAAGRLPAGWKYVLPTEAQWEYACRANTKTMFSFANNPNRLNEYAWWGAQLTKDLKPHARVVGSKLANPWGLHDMHGNAWEFCADRYSINFDMTSKGIDPEGPKTGTEWVVRGGAWFSKAESCRSASRNKATEGEVAPVLIGFRVALVNQ